VSADFREQLGRVERLIRSLEECPDPTARESARELVRALLELHAAGLAKMLALAGDDPTDRFAADPLVSGLLLLHGLHPRAAAERVKRALERSRPGFHALGGDAELLSATDEVVRLRLRGDPGCGPLLRSAVEEAVIEAVPDVTAVEFEEAWDHPLAGRMPLPLAGPSRRV
jgi:Fe-S cluster biogenesis protein NfuA